jgi:Staphylococcal nuclease homologue
MNSDTEKQMGTKRCSDLKKLSPVFNFLDHRLACDGGLSAKDRGIGFTISCFEIYASSDCAAMASLSMALAPFQGMSESYTAEEETPSSTAKALHVLPSRDYQSPIARRSDGKDLYSRTLAYVFLQDGTHLNAEIIRQGYGFAVSSSPPLKYQEEFRRLERVKRVSNGGDCGPAVHRGKDG